MVASGNVCIGSSSGVAVTEGDHNTVIGYLSGASITTGDFNTLLGKSSDCAAALNNQTSLGYQATCDLANQTTIGNSSMAIIRPGNNNICDLGESGSRFKDLHLAGNAFIGPTGQLRIKSTTGETADNFSIIIGNAETGEGGLSGNKSVFIGPNAGEKSAACTDNIGIGKGALSGLLLNTANKNTCVGNFSGNGLTTGDSNLYMGYLAGTTITTGIENVMLGADTDGLATLDNQTSLGYGATCDLSNQTTIGNASMVIVRPGADNTCDLGENDQQFKDLYLGGDAIIDGVVVLGEVDAHSSFFTGKQLVLDNQAGAVAITDLVFLDDKSATIKIKVDINATADLHGYYTIDIVNKAFEGAADAWVLQSSFIGDDTLITFSVGSTTGQVSYTTPAYTGFSATNTFLYFDVISNLSAN